MIRNSIIMIILTGFCLYGFQPLSKKGKKDFLHQYDAYCTEYKNGNLTIVGKYCRETLKEFEVILIDPDSKKLRNKYYELQSICDECLSEKGNESKVQKSDISVKIDTNDIKLEFARMTTGMDLDSVDAFSKRHPGWFEEDVVAIKKIATNRIINKLCDKEDWDEFTYWKDRISFPKFVYDTYKFYLVKDFSLKKMVLFGEAFQKDPLTINDISNRYEQYLYDRYSVGGDQESAKEYISRFPNGRFAADIKATLWQNRY